MDINIYDKQTRSVINDDFYLDIIQSEVTKFLLKSNSNIIIVSCGFDGHKNDKLQGFNLSNNAYRRIVAHLKKYNIPTLYVLEGRYDKYAISNSIFGMVEEMMR